MYNSTNYASPIGPMTLASDGEHIVGLWLEGQKYFAGTVKGAMLPNDSLPVFEAAKRWLD